MHIYMQHPIAASAQLAFLAKPELLIPLHLCTLPTASQL